MQQALQILLASSSPGFWPPVTFNGMIYIGAGKEDEIVEEGMFDGVHFTVHIVREEEEEEEYL